MAYNRVVRVKRGETKFPITVTLYEDTGDAINLANGGTWVVSIRVTADGSTDNLLEDDVMTNSNQTTHQGQAVYEMTDADAELAAGEYDLEITAEEPGGRIHKFPKDENQPFGTLIMLETNEAIPAVP